MNDLISNAAAFAREKHAGQLRDGGAPFIDHPATTAAILLQVTDDPELIAAAWLHDTLEDTATTFDELVQHFGLRVASLVQEVTHVRHQEGAYFPHLRTREGAMLKFADRLSNLSDMASWDDKRQDAYLKKSKFWKVAP